MMTELTMTPEAEKRALAMTQEESGSCRQRQSSQTMDPEVITNEGEQSKARRVSLRLKARAARFDFGPPP